MYTSYFGLKDKPFSITPDPGYLYMSPHHQEALAHLLYGTGEDGGFVQLTGEVGTGKTTLIRTLLEQHIEDLDVALCLNPKLTVNEFVASVCDELHVEYPQESTTLKPLVDALNRHLLRTHAHGRRTVLIIDEAQNLSHELLEQVRLLTNLETHRHKLLRIILVGQPELQHLLERQDLRQLAQRITARYHLVPLNRKDTAAYVTHRLKVAGGRENLFTRGALKSVYQLSHGVPRVINIISDRALLGAYVRGLDHVDAATLNRAAREALLGPKTRFARRRLVWGTVLISSMAMAVGTYLLHAKLPPLLLDETGSFSGYLGASPTPPRTHSTAQLESSQKIASEAGETVLHEPPAPSPSLQVTQAQPDPPLESAPSKLVGELTKIEPIEKLIKWLSDTPPTDDAIRRLLALWSEDMPFLSALPLCEEIRSLRLRCLDGQGGWDELHRYNRPLILYLKADGPVHQILMRSLDDQTATLNVEGDLIQIDRSALAPLWNGEYLMFWRLQTSYHLIGPGSWGESVRWLRLRLALAEGRTEEPLPSNKFDTALEQRVKRFQGANNLEIDGIVGARTMVLLNNFAPAPGTPFLTKSSANKPSIAKIVTKVP